MKRIYWLLIAAVPVMLWWLSQGSQSETKPAPAKPEPEKQPSAPETTPEAVKDLPTSSNGAPPKAAPAEVAVEAPEVAVEPESAPPEDPQPEPVAVVAPAAPAEKIEEAAETAPPLAAQIEAVPAPAVEGEAIQLFDSKDRPLECQLLSITSSHAQVRCPESLPEKEKVRLVLPFKKEAITVNGQLQGVEEGVSRFKIMTMKAGQKKRFEDYLAQRS